MAYVPQPPIEPHDAKAIQALADDRHSKGVGLTQDVGVITGWIWAGIRWPFRLILGIARR